MVIDLPERNLAEPNTHSPLFSKTKLHWKGSRHLFLLWNQGMQWLLLSCSLLSMLCFSLQMAKMLYISEMHVHFQNAQFVLDHIEFYIAYIIKLPIRCWRRKEKIFGDHGDHLSIFGPQMMLSSLWGLSYMYLVINTDVKNDDFWLIVAVEVSEYKKTSTFNDWYSLSGRWALPMTYLSSTDHPLIVTCIYWLQVDTSKLLECSPSHHKELVMVKPFLCEAWL